MVNFIRTISSKWDTVDKTQYKDSIVFIEDTKQIYVNGVYYAGGESSLVNIMIPITYQELKLLRDNSQLIPGLQYRITDYKTFTYPDDDVEIGGHSFDIIVIADSFDTLNENARAIQRDGDRYFSNSNLSAWRLKYSLDNNTNWCDNSGCGVIYQMIDEYGNEAQFDFKNIKFNRDGAYLYLFNVNIDGENFDASIHDGFANNRPRNNVFKHSSKESLLNGVFNITSNPPYNCKSYNNCTGWTCGDNCYNWTCESNCVGWTCGNNCYDWTCGNNCHGWTCGNGCFRWTCEDDCYDWTCGLGCTGWTCGSDCHGWTCGQYCKNWICRSNNSLWNVSSDVSNFEILSNTIQTDKNIGFDTNAQYTQTAGLDMAGELFVWVNSRSNYKLKIQEGTDTTIYPNSYNIWLNNRLPGIIRMAGRNTGGETREYLINFTVSGQTTTPSITFAQEVVWMNEAPIWQNGYIYEISIINVGNKNLATYNKFAL